MTAKITILGTSSAFPTKQRGHSATHLDVGSESMLFDCGENTQRQIALAGISPMKTSKIFLTHWHGDHVLGLGGLLQSFQMNKRKTAVNVYGPEQTRERFQHMLKAFEIRTQYGINVYEVKASATKPFKILEDSTYEIFAIKVKHPIPCLAFMYKEKDRRRVKKDVIKPLGLEGNPLVSKLQEGKDIEYKGKKITAKKATYMQPGKKIVYIIDAAYSEQLVKFASDADLLICESTFASDLKQEAREYGHMTAADAATLAKKAKAKKLVLTHFSQRYRDTNILLGEAKKIFQKTEAANDLDSFEI